HEIDDCNVTSALLGFVRMPRIDDHDDSRHRIWNREKNGGFSSAVASPLQRARKKSHTSISRTVLEKVYGDHHGDDRLAKPRPPRHRGGRLQRGGFRLERCFKMDPLLS